MNDDKYYVCRTQKDLYCYAANQKWNMKEFSDQFLQSDFCNRELDAEIYSVFQYRDEMEWIDFLNMEFRTAVAAPEAEISDYVAGWIGYMYRYLQISLCLHSREICRKVPFEAMVRYYPGLHTVDDEMAVEIVKEDFFDNSKEKHYSDKEMER